MSASAAADGDAPRGGRLWARIFQPLGDGERRAKYDDPLSRILDEAGIEHLISGYSLPADADHDVASIGIEVQVTVPGAVAWVVQAIADLGAPPTTLLELETDKVTVQLTLAEAEGG